MWIYRQYQLSGQSEKFGSDVADEERSRITNIKNKKTLTFIM